jgi:hypothetical protein
MAVPISTIGILAALVYLAPCVTTTRRLWACDFGGCHGGHDGGGCGGFDSGAGSCDP